MDADQGSIRGKRKSAISARDAQIAMLLQDRPLLTDKRGSKALFESSASTFSSNSKAATRMTSTSNKELRPKSSPTPRGCQTSKIMKTVECEKAPAQSKLQQKKVKVETNGKAIDDSEESGRVKRRSAVAAEDAQFARHLLDREYTTRKSFKMSEEEDAAQHHLSRNPAGMICLLIL
jgi:hypothetical protein